MDMNGQTLKIFECYENQRKFDFSTGLLKSGVYFIKYLSDKGEQKIKRLLIVE